MPVAVLYSKQSLDRLKISQFCVTTNYPWFIQVKGGMFQKLQRLPDGCPPGLDDDLLSSLNQLLEFWHNSRGAVFIDDQVELSKYFSHYA